PTDVFLDGRTVRKPTASGHSDPLTACSDEELFARARGGEETAFAVLVRRYERELYGYLRRYLGDATLADDVFQNTFLQLHLKRDQYEAGRPVRPWLYTIATHQAIDALRRVGRHPTVSLEQQTGDDGGGDSQRLAGLLEAAGPAPFERVSTEEARELVRQSVENLPEFLREVVNLAYFQGLPYRDVAEVLSIPVGTVKSRLHTALQRLQDVWSSSPSLREV
ncbi:MAG TPA: sigma-70 family RNA polymerase sigma factor, partial [Gemmataceae bacterium]|nr:sigma-70 family RNA polymerase sigma factor [Gemmataceae bacterium]